MNTETKFTPGPWKTSKGSFLHQININTETDTLATVYGESGENWANARLIAAAPELYNALARALPLLHTGDELPMEYYKDKQGLLGVALRALAKARGES